MTTAAQNSLLTFFRRSHWVTRMRGVDWLAFTLFFSLAVVILLLPGWLLGYAIGLRGALALLCAAPLSISLISVVAFGLAVLPIPWTPVNFVAGALVVTLVLHLGWWVHRLSSAQAPYLRIINLNPISLTAGLVVVIALTVGSFVVMFSSPDYFVQTSDNLFQLNAIRYSLDSGQPATFAIVQLNLGSWGFPAYPGAWEDYISLIVATAGYFIPSISIATAVNAGTLAVLILGWSLGCLVLAQVMAGRSLKTTLPAGVLAASIYLFGWQLIALGNYPALMAYAALAAALTVLGLMANLRSETPPLRALRRFSRKARADKSASLTSTGPQRGQPPADPDKLGLFGAHPHAILVVLLISALVACLATEFSAAATLVAATLVTLWATFFVRLFQPANWVAIVGRILAGLVLVSATAGFGWAWLLVANGSTASSPALTNPLLEILNLAQGTPAGTAGTTALTVLLVLGVVASIWRRKLVGLTLFVLSSALYVLAVGGPFTELARILGAPFAHDARLMAACWLVMSMPLLLTGIGGVGQALELVTSRLSLTATRALEILVTLLLVGAIGVPQQLLSVQPQLSSASQRLIVPSATTMVSADEFTLLHRLSTVVPAGYRLVGDPGNGSAFAYAIAGVPVVFSGLRFTDSVAATQLRTAMFDKQQIANTCLAVASLQAYYFADFGTSEDASTYPGLAHPDASMLAEVAREGDAAVYRFTACDG